MRPDLAMERCLGRSDCLDLFTQPGGGWAYGFGQNFKGKFVFERLSNVDILKMGIGLYVRIAPDCAASISLGLTRNIES